MGVITTGQTDEGDDVFQGHGFYEVQGQIYGGKYIGDDFIGSIKADIMGSNDRYGIYPAKFIKQKLPFYRKNSSLESIFSRLGKGIYFNQLHSNSLVPKKGYITLSIAESGNEVTEVNINLECIKPVNPSGMWGRK